MAGSQGHVADVYLCARFTFYIIILMNTGEYKRTKYSYWSSYNKFRIVQIVYQESAVLHFRFHQRSASCKTIYMSLIHLFVAYSNYYQIISSNADQLLYLVPTYCIFICFLTLSFVYIPCDFVSFHFVFGSFSYHFTCGSPILIVSHCFSYV